MLENKKQSSFLIELKGTSKFYKTHEGVSVGMKQINVGFELNEFVAIVGSSGSGKSTLLNVISGLDGYEEGEMYFQGKETSHYKIDDWERYRAAYIGFVFQNYNIIDSYTVLQNVMLALEIQNYPIKNRKKRALELIDRVGLTSHKHHKASKLSGGQKQRTVIARALAKDSPIIVADEPTGNLDSASATEVMNLLNEISKDKLVIVVTHDYDLVEPYATRKIKMTDGNIIEDEVLKKHEKSDIVLTEKLKQMSFFNVLKFAFKNMFSQPKKFIFVLLLQVIIASALTYVYTAQVKSIRETELGAGAFFIKTPKTRMLIQRRDGSQLTNEDVEYFNKLRDVNKVYLHGEHFYNNLTNASLYYKDNIHYTWDNGIEYFDAASSLKKHQVSGRLPKNKNEIVITSDFNYKIGDEVIFSSQSRIYDLNISLENNLGEFVVVGLTNISTKTVYFPEEYIEETEIKPIIDTNGQENLITDLERNVYFDGNFQKDGKDYYFYGSSYEDTQSNIKIYPETFIDDNLIDYELKLEYRYWYGYNAFIVEKTYNVKLKIVNNIEVNDYLHASLDDSIYNDFVEYVKEKTQHFFITYPEEVISLSIDGYAAGNRLLNKIDHSVYRVYYPANISSMLRPLYVFLKTILAVVLILLVGMFLYTVLHAVTKNVMASRKKDFAIYRSIGANKTTLGKLIILEQVIISLLSLFIVLIFSNIGSYFSLFLQGITSYLLFKDYILLIFIFMFFGIIVGVRFNKKVFNQTVVETLSLDREDL